VEIFTKDIDGIKPGTNVLVNTINDVPVSLNERAFFGVGRQASAEGGPAVAVITSAAIAAGMIQTGTEIRPDKATDNVGLQSLASNGGKYIANMWDRSIVRPTGDLYLTRTVLDPPADDKEHKAEKAKALNVICDLFRKGWVPVINENDPVADDEITFGDNDILSALLMVAIKKSLLFSGRLRLFLLSDTNGIYADKDEPLTRIPMIEDTEEYRHLEHAPHSKLSSGGVKSKFIAADLVNAAGIPMWLFDGRTGSHRNRAVNGDIGTYFPAKENPRVLSKLLEKLVNPQVVQ
jgi:glutamate 5-kinase